MFVLSSLIKKGEEDEEDLGSAFSHLKKKTIGSLSADAKEKTTGPSAAVATKVEGDGEGSDGGGWDEDFDFGLDESVAEEGDGKQEDNEKPLVSQAESPQDVDADKCENAKQVSKEPGDQGKSGWSSGSDFGDFDDFGEDEGENHDEEDHKTAAMTEAADLAAASVQKKSQSLPKSNVLKVEQHSARTEFRNNHRSSESRHGQSKFNGSMENATRIQDLEEAQCTIRRIHSFRGVLAADVSFTSALYAGLELEKREITRNAEQAERALGEELVQSEHEKEQIAELLEETKKENRYSVVFS